MPLFGSHFLFGRGLFGTYIRLGGLGRGSPKLASGSFSARGYYLVNGAAAQVLYPGGTILTNLGTFIRGIDVASQAIKDAAENALASWAIKVYIQDASSNPKWVDFTDRVEWRGRNQVLSIGRLEYSGERRVGALQQRMSNLTLDNTDGFWSRPWVETNGGFTHKLLATYDSNWNFLNDYVSSPGATPTSASSAADTRWHLSTNGEQTALYHHKVAVRVEFEVKGGVPEAATMGVFLIESSSCDSESETASLTLAPLTKPLTEGSKAEAVKEGHGWYRNRSPKFLIEELLKEEYADSTNQLPDDWNIENIIDYDVPLAGRNRWVTSHFGRPPEQTIDATVDPDGIPSWETDPIKISRAVCMWEYGKNSDTLGTISVTPGSTIVTGASTAWLAGGQPAKVGDAFIIPKEFTAGDGGSAYENDGRYTIASVDSNISITLNRPVEGTQAELSLIYSIPRLYVGAGNELYEYNITTDTYYYLGELADKKTYIARIWHNTSAQSARANDVFPIWGVGLTDLGENNNNLNESMQIFRFRWSSGAVDFDSWGAIMNCFSGQWVFREADLAGSTQWLVGNFLNHTDTCPIVIPYEQLIVNMRNTDYDLDVWTGNGLRNYVDGTTTPDVVNNAPRAYIDKPDFYHARSGPAKEAITLRYTSGQTGFIVFQPNFSTNGAIFFAATAQPALDTDTQENTVVPYNFTYYIVNFAQADPGAGAVTKITLEGADDVEGTNYTGYLPMCGCPYWNNDSVYVGLCQFTQGSILTNAINSAILIIDYPGVNDFSRLQRHTTANEYFFQDMVVTENDHLYVTCIDLEEFVPIWPAAGDSYRLIGYEALVQDGARTVIFTAHNLLQGMCLMNIGAGSPSDKIFLQVPTENRLYMLDDTIVNQNTTATLLSSNPAIEEESSVLHNQVAYSETIKEMYWISSPAPFFTLSHRAQGKFALCKYSPTYPARVELADFSGMSIWDAIRDISDIVDGRFGFRPDGVFFFIRRPQHEDSVYTFTNVSASRMLKAVRVDGEEDIINEAIRTPSSSSLGDIEISLRIKADSKAKNYSLEAEQISERAVKIKLLCVRGGTANGAIWAYTTLRGVANTTLRTSYTKGNPFVSIDDPTDVVYGSFLSVKGIDTADEEIEADARVGYVIKYTAIDPASPELTLSTVVDSLTSVLSVNKANVDSAQMDNAHIFLAGDIILVANIGTESSYEYMAVTGVESAKIYVARGHGGNCKPIAHSIGEKIILIRNGYDIFTTTNLTESDGYNFTAGDKVEIEHPDEDAWSQSYYHDPADASSTTASSEITWQGKNGSFVPIGGANNPHSTGVSLKLTWIDPGDGDTIYSNYFIVGDLIRITAQGMINEEDQASLRIFSDLVSQSKYKKRTDDSSNRFMDAKQSYWKVRQVVQDYAYPRYRFTVDSILTPWIMPIDVVSIQHPALLPRATEKTVACYVTSISFDLQHQGLETIEMRAINPY